MTPSALMAALCFGGLGLAMFLLGVALRGTDGTAPKAGRNRGALRPEGRQLLIAIAASAATLLVTGWPVAAAAVGGLLGIWPSLLAGTRAERQAIARLEALATWTESLRDTIAGAVGLEQAIPTTTNAAHPAVRPHLLRLCGRLEARQPLPEALRQLASDLDDPSADLVIAALVLNAELRGPGLRQTLTALAASAREELDMRRRVEAGRRAIRRGVRIVVAVTVGFLAVLAAFNRDYLAPYDTAVGQITLAVVVCVFGAGFALLRVLAAVDMPARILVTRTGRGPQ